MILRNYLGIFCLNLILCLVGVYGGRDLYGILEVDPRATKVELKQAYKRLARKWHPDKNDHPDAPAKFAEISAAYEILIDEKTRKKYDTCGEECVKKDGFMDNPMDSFASFFGDFGFHFGGESETRSETRRGATIVMDLYVSLEELYSGNFVEITHNKPVLKPSPGTRRCNCRQELITKQLGPGQFQMMQKTVCDECPNVKFVNEDKHLEVEIEKGMNDGSEIKFVGEGEPHIDGEPGDLILKIKTLPHPVFERKGDDLYTNVTISLLDALQGFTMEIEHLDGRKVKIQRDKVTWPGARIRKKGEGMPNFENNQLFGILYITFDVEFPKIEFSSEDKKALREILKQKSVNNVYNGFRTDL